MCILMMDHDPTSLSPDFRDFPLLKALADMEHGVYFRLCSFDMDMEIRKVVNV